MRKRTLHVMALLAFAPTAVPATAQQPEIAVPSNMISLRLGMNADETAEALGVPLIYIRGRPGNELYLVLSNVKGSALSSRSDGLYLQFRKGKLAGWKGDWGTIRP
ncbi:MULTISPECIES: hypothetical protein [unclassified Bradyrhizobium]|uniref:hypothetical protein n=1 Tax=unclassified Bradyrhizobium TaxID=2631580 RepID=UPI002479C86E|nr:MULTISPECIES: hypothetical protein [unclassified Bradyrhizobium]WGS23535.1 hypothetical protein MTX22_19085 [Bradyrhizobium sp. ISRA463]WGS30558.1 hypothetical protein MTX19_16810 [Bradyrhizobium sp. ISRA464]